MRRLALALLTTCLLGACGQTGKLYLPGSERESVGTATPATPANTPATDERDENAARNKRGN